MKENLNKVGHFLKIILVIGFIVFEEIAWKRIGEPAYRIVSSLKIMDRFKAWIADIDHRYALLGVFIVPFLLMEGSSLLAFKAWGTGALFTGIGFYTIKLLMTAPVVIIFNAGKSRLVSFWIIKYSFGAILNFKRTQTFRSVKRWTKKLKEDLVIFKNEYLDTTDGNFSESFKRLYTDLKNNS